MPIYGRSSNAITKHGKKQENYDATQQKNKNVFNELITPRIDIKQASKAN